MIYVNKRTGATIDSPCLLSGEDWECVSEAAKEVATVEEMETVEEENAKEAEEAKEEKPKKKNNKKGE